MCESIGDVRVIKAFGMCFTGDEMVGETGFEPAASWSQTMRATNLRHSPTPNYLLSKYNQAHPFEQVVFRMLREQSL